MNKKPNSVIKKFKVNNFDLAKFSPIIDNLYYNQDKKNQIEIQLDVLYQGKLNMNFDFFFHLFDTPLQLNVNILELYGRIGLLFQQGKAGKSKFYFTGTPIY